jgi:hypothetical protein
MSKTKKEKLKDLVAEIKQVIRNKKINSILSKTPKDKNPVDYLREQLAIYENELKNLD